MSQRKKKIAVLGGGAGSLSAVFGITETPNWQDKYEITVYQLGWRLGGKGASGRNPNMGNRIEEHGLHIWFGFYENAFRVMQSCYDALWRANDVPHATWDKAFKPHNFVAFCEYHQGRWKEWYYPFPAKDGVPGIGERNLSSLDYIKRATDWIIENALPLFTISDEVIDICHNSLVHTKKSEKLALLLKFLPSLLSNSVNPLFTTSKTLTKLIKVAALLDIPLPLDGNDRKISSALKALQFILANIDISTYQENVTHLTDEQKREIIYLLSPQGETELLKLIGKPLEHHPLNNLRYYIILHYLLQLLSEYLKELLQLLNKIEENPNEAINAFSGMKSIASLIEIAKVALKIIPNSNYIDGARRACLLTDLMVTCCRGIIDDGVWLFGFDIIDNKDFRQWLLDHGAHASSAYCAPVRGFYDLALAYPKGDIGNERESTKGKCCAGITLHALLLMLFAYKGAYMWKMQAGMGDVVFTPLYEVLHRRGVRFKFFHKITHIIPNKAGNEIEKIIVNEQVMLKNGLQEYHPLVTVKGLPCWPSFPNYDQIEDGDALRYSRANLESHWTTWNDAKKGVTLELGKDFDLVICGIPFEALKIISEPLAATSNSWRLMLNNLQSVATLSMQLWSKHNLERLGWQQLSPILNGYEQPFNTWADMSQTLAAESWTTLNEPENISYFCGVLPNDELPLPPNTITEFPELKKESVRLIAISWIENHLGRLWKSAIKGNQFNWDVLIDPLNRNGNSRFYAQYWRANVEPSDRYTLSIPGTNQYRLKSDGSDFRNLFLAGDWVDNGFLNVGCVEATVISGLQASEAITGTSLGIIY